MSKSGSIVTNSEGQNPKLILTENGRTIQSFDDLSLEEAQQRLQAWQAGTYQLLTEG